MLVALDVSFHFFSLTGPLLGKEIDLSREHLRSCGYELHPQKLNSTVKIRLLFTTVKPLEDGLPTLVICVRNLGISGPWAGNGVPTCFRSAWLRVPAPKRRNQPHSDSQHWKPKVCMMTTTFVCTLQQVGGVLCSTAYIL